MSRFTETQNVKTLKQGEGGRTVKEVCRGLGISEATTALKDDIAKKL